MADLSKDIILRKLYWTDEFKEYRKKTRGENVALRCDFPELMGWSLLRRPEALSPSLQVPYFSGEFAPLSNAKERIMRPHMNRLRVWKDSEDNHMTLRKFGIILKPGPPSYQSKWGELRLARWKSQSSSNKEVEILVRMYNKHSGAWKQVETKMLREVCHVKETGHPNFLQYFGSVETPFWKYHVFEYMPKKDLLNVLKKQLDKDEYLPSSIVKKIFVQIVFAISHLHDKDLVHRNLKLENILVGNSWEVRIIDITHAQKTVAQIRGDNRTSIPKTVFDPEYGPVNYRSPERFLGWGFNPLLDQVWGLGVILYALFFKKFPFTFPKDEDMVNDELERGVRFPRGYRCPQEAKQLLTRIMVWEEKRPRSYELLDDPWISSYGHEEIEEMKKNNMIGRYTHEQAEKMRDEEKRLLLLRKKMFRHFKLFREDYKRQPTLQAKEMENVPRMLRNMEQLMGGPRPYGEFEMRENLKELHKTENLHKEEYWPKFHRFNPFYCQYLGINRCYCKPHNLPISVNLQRLQNKEIPQYTPPPRRHNRKHHYHHHNFHVDRHDDPEFYNKATKPLPPPDRRMSPGHDFMPKGVPEAITRKKVKADQKDLLSKVQGIKKEIKEYELGN